MRKVYLVFCVLLVSLSLQAQKSQMFYDFSATSGTYTQIPILSPGVTQTSAAYPTHDEGFANNIPLGFTFNYNGTNYTTINANTNGFASFQTFSTISDPNQNYWLSDLEAGTYGPTKNRPILAPLWDDLDLFGAADIKYQTTGAAPNRVFTLQWSRVYWTVAANSTSIEFQIKLYEGTNVIDFQYLQLAGTVAGTPSAAIGITAAGTGPGKYLSLNNSSSSPTVSSTVNTYTIATRPASGQIYRFTPGAVLDPNTLNYTFTALSGTYSHFDGATPAFIVSGKPGATLLDEGIADSIGLNFPFVYNGNTYGFVAAHTNGFLSFQSLKPITNTATQNYSTPDLANGPNGVATGNAGPNGGRPVLAPLWDDLAIAAESDLRYQTTGSAPNRVFTIAWSNVYWKNNASAPSISFQIKLYETTNVIEYYYLQHAGAVNNGAAAIGITGINTGSGNFISLKDASAAPQTSTVVSTNNISTRPATGQIYRFTPTTTPVCTPIKATTDVSVTASAPDNFFGAVNDTRQVFVTVRELGAIASDAVVVRITKAQASGYTFAMGTGSDNANWTRTEDATFVSFTRTGGLLCGDNSTLAINMTRTNPAGQQFNVTFRVLPSASQSADYRYNDSFSLLFVSDSQ